MATISIEVKQASASGDVLIPNAEGPAITFTPPRVSIGGYVRTAKAFSVTLVDGTATVVLSPTPDGKAYRAVESWSGGDDFYFTVTGDQAYATLTRVDPSTLDLEPEEPAWSAALDALRDLIGTSGGGGGGSAPPAASTTVAGVVELATPTETTTGTDSVRAVTPAGVAAALAALVGSAPGALNTLKELADALGNDASFATTVSNNIAERAAKTFSLGVVVQAGGTYPAPPPGYASYLYLGATDPASLGITLGNYDQWIGPS